MTNKIDWDKVEEDHDEYLQEVTGYPLKWRDTNKDKEDDENKEKGDTEHV